MVTTWLPIQPKGDGSKKVLKYYPQMTWKETNPIITGHQYIKLVFEADNNKTYRAVPSSKPNNIKGYGLTKKLS